MGGERIRAVQERRRSNAAGPHGRRATRADELGEALALEDLAPDEDEEVAACEDE